MLLGEDIIAKYPRLYARQKYSVRFFQCGMGWLDLIDETLQKLDALLKDYDMDEEEPCNVVDVKEKFGGLRIYVWGDYPHEAFFDVIQEAESRSFTICEDCGQTGKRRPGSYIRTLCDDHYEKNIAMVNAGRFDYTPQCKIDSILICTHNPNKQREFRSQIHQCPVPVQFADEFPTLSEPIEDAPTYIGNALKKAKSAFDQTGIPSLADDSGLEVMCLDNNPGICSARFSGVTGPGRDKANRELLLQKLQSHPQPWTARYRCFLVFVWGHHPWEWRSFSWTWRGQVIPEERGENDFAYDTLFFLPELQKTAAQLTVEEKNQYSHRANAFAHFCRWLKYAPQQNKKPACSDSEQTRRDL